MLQQRFYDRSRRHAIPAMLATTALVASGLFLSPGAVQAQTLQQLINDAPWFEREVGDGILWRYYQFEDMFGGRQSISYMIVDLANPAVDLALNYREAWVGPSPGLDSPDFPRELTSAFAAEIPGSKAAINGSFFNTQTYGVGDHDPNDPWGGGTQYLKVDGNVIVGADSGGAGILFNDRSDVTIMPRPEPWGNIAPSWDNMMANSPILVNGGVVNTDTSPRHPRSVLGVDQAGETLYMIVVDGRTDEALGMTIAELAELSQALGSHDAFNLDGGGSSTLWAAGEPFNGVVNYPSDNGAYDRLGQRRAANALIITSGDPAAAAWDGRLTSLDAPSVTRSFNNVTIVAEIENLGTETWEASELSIVPSRPFGRTSTFIPLGDEDTFFEMEPATVAPGQTATFTLNLIAPDVSENTMYREEFALWHDTEEFFGPADSAIRMDILVRPEIPGAPDIFIVQGLDGPNNQWYHSLPNGGAFNSSVSFTAEGVTNSGTQRLYFASQPNRGAEFRPIFDIPGIYRIEVAFPHSGSSITSVTYTVEYLDGTYQTTLNQQDSNLANQWIELGEFPFSDGIARRQDGVHSVRVSNESVIGDRIYSGAIRVDFVEPLETSVDTWVLY